MSVRIKQNQEIAAKVWKFKTAQTWAGGSTYWIIHHYEFQLSNTLFFRQKLTRRKFMLRQGKIRLENKPFSIKLLALNLKPEDTHLLSTYSSTFPGFILWFALRLKIIKTVRQTWKIPPGSRQKWNWKK